MAGGAGASGTGGAGNTNASNNNSQQPQNNGGSTTSASSPLNNNLGKKPNFFNKFKPNKTTTGTGSSKNNNNKQNKKGGRSPLAPGGQPGSRNWFKGSSLIGRKNQGEKKQDAASVKSQVEKAKYKQRIKKGKEAIKKLARTAAGPLGGLAAGAALHTSKGKRYLDAYAKGSNDAEGIQNVKKEIDKDKRKRKILIRIVLPLVLFMLLIFLIGSIFKGADSFIFSSENNGTVYSEDYIPNDKVRNVFANFPGLYEEIMTITDKVSNEYQVDIDKYLIVATLVAPISNELIAPIEDNSCGEEKCYYFNNESVTWSEFLESWSHQAELLAKMQILTYTNNDKLKINCGAAQTMEQYAQNDKQTNTFPWYGWINPGNWFKGFVDAVDAEVNAKCVDAKSGESEVPVVRVLSIEQGDYHQTVDKNGELSFIKDPNSGGVYFWNLVNKNGFIHEYLKDYLSDEYADDPDKNYEINKKEIVETVNFIYSFYEEIRKDCNGRQVIKGELKKIKFREDSSSPTYTLDFEDVFVGGSVLATFGSATGDIATAQAILTRSEAYNYIVEQGKDVIIGTAKMGCWWWKYNPTYDPSYENQKDNPNYDPDYPKVHYPEIYRAVTETRGIVVTNFGNTKVLETEYDAFCPTTKDPLGDFYYLPDGQRYLPIEFARFGTTSWSDCPCFQNESSRPTTEFEETLAKLTKKSIGTPSQTTLAKCWTPTGETKTVIESGIEKTLHGFSYEPTGGHGRGVSQHGMAYFAGFGYDYEALIKLFLEREGLGVSLRRYDDSILDGECVNHGYFNPDENKLKDEDKPNTSNSNETSSDSNVKVIVTTNYNGVIGGTPLNKPLPVALSENGHTMQDLNNCISNRVKSAGPGTRDGVVAASVGLLECMINLTGGYTLPYDHLGGKVGEYNPDLTGKIGANSLWGNTGGWCDTVQEGPCRLGLNCANFVRWAMCNGGMDLCSRGSSFAVEMFSTQYFPGGVKVRINRSFQIEGGSSSISSSEEAVNNIKPGDVLYSRGYVNGGSNHVMIVVGTNADSITIAENGRKTRKISKSELLNSKEKEYSVLLLDDYYANSNNKNQLYSGK